MELPPTISSPFALLNLVCMYLYSERYRHVSHVIKRKYLYPNSQSAYFVTRYALPVTLSPVSRYPSTPVPLVPLVPWYRGTRFPLLRVGIGAQLGAGVGVTLRTEYKRITYWKIASKFVSEWAEKCIGKLLLHLVPPYTGFSKYLQKFTLAFEFLQKN